MKQQRILSNLSLFVIGLVAFGFLEGCGILNSIAGLTKEKNPPFKNELGLMVVTPGASFNPQTASSQLYNQVEALTAKGRMVMLNASRQPILFEAYWCPHCQRTLIALNKNKAHFKRLPVLVSEGFVPGTTLLQAIHLTSQEISAYHLNGFRVYYILNTNEVAKNSKNGFPTLVFSRQGHLFTLTGEHTLAVWEKAINSTK